jgi:LysM repeat protein
MARSRSSRRRRPVSRVLVPVLIGGCLVFAGYFLLPGGEPEPADATPPKASQAPVKSTELKDSPAKPAADTPPTTKPSGSGTAKAGQPEPAASRIESAPPSTQPVTPNSTAVAVSGATAVINRAVAIEKENPLEARRILNDALQAGKLDHASAESVKARIRELNRTIIFNPVFPADGDPQQSKYVVEPGDSLAKICRTLPVPYGFIARVNAVKPERIRVGQSLKLITVPIHAVVNKKHFTMDLYLGALPGEPGSMYLTTYRVGLGEHGSTPTGLWQIAPNSKAVNPAWANPRDGKQYGSDDPENPIGEHWMGLTGIEGDAVGAVSYGIHGTIEPETIGTNASMGCIRLTAEDVAAVYDMLSEGRSTVLVVKE